MAEVKHRVFNPNTVGTGYSPLDQVCKYEEGEGWRLTEVIPHHTYESVAVFERGGGEETSAITTHGIQGANCGLCGGRVPPNAHHTCTRPWREDFVRADGRS